MIVHLGKPKNTTMLNFDLPMPAALLLAAVVPTILGFIWYNPKVFGNAWMQAAGLTPESAKGMNMPVVFGVSLLLSVMLAFSLQGIVIHQRGLESMLMGMDTKTPGTDTYNAVTYLFNTYGHNYRTFRHGALHGTILGIFTILPIIATGAMFERKSFKYIAINAGYWIVCLAIMGGIICKFFPIKMM
jgi:hypothetical protein